MAAARTALAAWALTVAVAYGGGGGKFSSDKPPSKPDQLCGSTRIKGSNCGGTGCHASSSCECIMHNVMSAECGEDTPFLKALPGLHVHSFRIPSIVKTGTALVTFAEARQGAYGNGAPCVLPACKGTGFQPTDDMGPKTIAFKRSTDSGASWSPLRYVPGLYQPGWVVGNPTAVWDAEAKLLVLHVLNSTLVAAPFNDSMTSTGFTLQLTTKDDGQTWTRPFCLNKFLGPKGVSGIAPGPGNAIQLQSRNRQKGRLLFPGWGSLCFDADSCNHGTYNGSLTYAAVYYSDDHGVSWQVGGTEPADLHGPVSEPTLAELTDGSILLNMRSVCSPSNGGELKNASICDAIGMMAARMTSISTDFGMSFSAPRFQKDLPSPNDQGSTLRGVAPVAQKGKSRSNNTNFPVYFSGPYSRTTRNNISIMASFDNSKTYTAQTVVYPMAAKYSCLSYLNESHISLVMEAHNSKVSSFDITFMAVVPPAAASGGASPHSSPPPAPLPPAPAKRKEFTAACTVATDCTAELQAALASGAERLTIPKLPNGRSWIVTPLRLHSHQTIVMERGVEILAKRGAFQSKYTGLLTGVGVDNVSILAAPGAQIRMRRQDYANATPGVFYAKAEWRHGINLVGVNNVKISGLRVTETGGDGLQVASCEKGCAPTKPGLPVRTASTNVEIVDCIFDHNYRQGISVISAANLLIKNCTLSHTGYPWGTPPMAGLDLEPDEPTQAMTNVTLQDCRSIGNRGGGFNMYLRRSDATSPPVSVAFRNCTVDGAGQQGISIGAMSPGTGLGGTGVLVDGCSVRNSIGWGLAVFDKAGTGPPVVVRNSYFEDVAKNATTVSPMARPFGNSSVAPAHLSTGNY